MRIQIAACIRARCRTTMRIDVAALIRTCPEGREEAPKHKEHAVSSRRGSREAAVIGHVGASPWARCCLLRGERVHKNPTLV